jgi:hypothetical protein
MIHHVSIPAREPQHVAEVLAELMGGKCYPLPVALIATGLLTHGSGKLFLALLKGRGLDAQASGPQAGETARQ